MSFSRALVAFVAIVSFAILTVGCEEPLPPGVDPVETGPVTIKVVSAIDHATAMSDVKVAVNAADGSIIADGVTDASGTFTVAEIEAGASATIASEDTRQGPMLQTKFELKPNATYTFTVFKDPRVVGQITVTGTNIPSGTYQDAYVGNCRLSLGIQEDLTEDCIQSDGKITIYAYAYDTNRVTRGRAVAYDVTFTDGMTVNLDDWYSAPTTGFNFAAVNASTAIIDAFFELHAQRRGTQFRLEASNYGEVSENTFTNYSVYFPKDLPAAENGHGFLLEYQHSIQTATGIRFNGFISRKQWITSPMQVDLSQAILPVEITSLVGDFSDNVSPAANWTVNNGDSADAAILVLQWANSGKDITWTATTPMINGHAKLPALPASMSNYAPATGGVVTGPILLTADSSRVTGYDEFAQNESSIFLFERTIEGGSTEATIKYNATISTDFVLKTTPEQQKQLPLLRLLKTL